MDETCQCSLPAYGWTLKGSTDGRLVLFTTGTSQILHEYRFSGMGVAWVLVSTSGETFVAGHDDGFVIAFDRKTGEERVSCQMQSEYKSTTAETWGQFSPDDRWLLTCVRKSDAWVGYWFDLTGELKAKRFVATTVSDRPFSLDAP